MNSFKELEREQMALFSERKTEKVYEKISGSLDTLRFFGSILEIYMPVMADTFVSLTGGEPMPAETNDWIDELDEEEDNTSDFPDDEPTGPGGVDFPVVR